MSAAAVAPPPPARVGAAPPVAVLLTRLPMERLPVANLQAALQAHPLLDGAPVAPLPGIAMPSSTVLGLGPRRVTVLALTGGAPPAVIQPALTASSADWPDAAAAAGAHRGHVLIAPYPGGQELAEQDHFAAGPAAPALAVTLVAAALAQVAPALGLALLWQPTRRLLPLAALQSRMASVTMAALPWDLWLTVERETLERGGMRYSTRGLTALGQPAELEALAPQEDAGTAALLDAVAMALLNGADPAEERLALPDGRVVTLLAQESGLARVVLRQGL